MAQGAGERREARRGRTASALGTWPSTIARLCAGGLLGLAAGCHTPPPVIRPPEPPPPPAPTAAPVPVSRLPRAMALIDEKNLGTIPTAEVEALTAAKLIAAHIPVIDQDMVRANLQKDQHLLKTAGDNRGAAAVGLQFGADVIIVGEAVAKPSARRIGDSNLRSYQAAVTLRAVQTDNAAVLASCSEDATVVALDDVVGGAQALKTAGEKSLDALIPALLNAWARLNAEHGRDGVFPFRVTLTVGGVDQTWKLKAVRERLRAAAEARDVTQRSYTVGVAVFECETAVSPEEFAETLVLHPPEGLKMQVLSTESGKLNMKAVTPGS